MEHAVRWEWVEVPRSELNDYSSTRMGEKNYVKIAYNRDGAINVFILILIGRDIILVSLPPKKMTRQTKHQDLNLLPNLLEGHHRKLKRKKSMCLSRFLHTTGTIQILSISNSNLRIPTTIAEVGILHLYVY